MPEDEVTPEEQAAMAIKLHDNVRELVKGVLEELFSDPGYMQYLMDTSPFGYTIKERVTGDGIFVHRVQEIIQRSILVSPRRYGYSPNSW